MSVIFVCQFSLLVFSVTKYRSVRSNIEMNQRTFKFQLHDLFGFFMVFLVAVPGAYGESPAQIKSEEEIVRKQMVQWSQELGVTCTECHNIKNFKENSFKSFKVGQEHARIVSVMKEHGFDGIKGPLANCYMCHRGTLRPPAQDSHRK